MQTVFSFFGRVLLLLYIHARRFVPKPLRRVIYWCVRALTPKALRTPYRHWRTRVQSLGANDGFRGLFSQFFFHFTEFWVLLKWLLADKERPGIKSAIVPTILKFVATTLQAFSFAIIAGYITLAANDWTFSWKNFVITIEPNLMNTLGMAVIIFGAYVGFAILNYISGNLMLEVGLKYQNVLSERVLNHYRDVSLDATRGDYIDSNLLLSVINSESRYLGRALMMLYNIIYQIILAGIGFFTLVALDANFAIACVVFMGISLVFQVGVMGKTLNDTRKLLQFTGANTLALRSAITKISLSPTMFNLTRNEINASLRTKTIQNYDNAYYDRLRVGLFASMVPQLVFALFVAGIFGYSVYAINTYKISAALSVQYVLSLRFFLGGLAGVLVGFVSIISFKPFFDNYINMTNNLNAQDEGRPLDTGVDPDLKDALETNSGLHLMLKDTNSLSMQPGQSVSVVVNKGAISWLDISFILNRVLLPLNAARLVLKRDVGVVHIEFPLIENNGYQSMGIDSAADFARVRKRLDFMGAELDVLEAALMQMENSPQNSTKIWAGLKGVHFMIGSLMACILNKKPILFFSESAFRAITERDRKVVMDLISDRFIFIHHYALPAYVLKPIPQAFLLLDKAGLIASYTAEEILDLPQDVINNFAKTSFAPDNLLAFLDEEI